MQDRYELDQDGKEVYPTENNIEVIRENRYAKNINNEPYYPKNEKGDEYIIKTLGLIKIGEKYYYPKRANGITYYQLDDEGNEIYEMVDSKYIFREDVHGKQYYAKNKDLDECYPSDYSPAKTEKDQIYYAVTAEGLSSFPKDENGNEFYLSLLDFKNANSFPDRYAENKNERQIYPKCYYGELIRECPLRIRNGYALNEEKRFYYPRDAYNNEYYLDTILANYAMTNDGKVILKETEMDPFIIDPDKQPIIKEENVIGSLIRGPADEEDYLTDVQLPYPPNIKPKKYKYRDIKTKTIIQVIPKAMQRNTWYLWVLVFLSIPILFIISRKWLL